jgi:hypothetical protein
MSRRAIFWIGFLGLAACRTVEPDEHATEDLDHARSVWTDAFLEPAVLVADEITIEGPPGLLEHVAIRQDPELVEFVTETTTQGLRQEYELLSGVGAAEIQGQIDAWVLAALRQLVVLERPGEAPVIVRASGNAAWIPADGSGERRGSSLVFEGTRPILSE